MAVQADQRQPGLAQRGADRLFRGAGGDGEAELGVFLAGLDVRVGVRADAGRQPQPDRDRPRRPARGQLAQQRQLVEVVHHDAADVAVERIGQLVARLVVAVEVDAFGGEAGVQRDVQLAAGYHVQLQALLGHELRDRGAEISLGRIGGPRGRGVAGSQGRAVLGGAAAQRRLVEDIERRAVVARQRGDRDAAHGEHAVLVQAGGDGPEFIHVPNSSTSGQAPPVYVASAVASRPEGDCTRNSKERI
ncbi:MAG: hypothetical protein BWY52_03245 [Chloroflexi bacterium ADurb.Bin325]|nr:MAG: hypothetical protein BWY52_03245 [Chloroflexi bacterium ADurb.Bin325]